MTTRITITLPEGFSDEQTGAYLNEHWNDFREALDLTGDYYDRKSQVDKINSLAVSLGTSDQLEEAERVIASVVSRRKLNPRDPDLTLALGNHGFILLILGKFKAAEQAATEALEVGMTTQGLDAPNTLQARNLLGYAYECQEKWADAERVLTEVLTIRRSLPPSSTDLQRSLGFVARIYAKQQKWEIACKFLAELMIAQHPDEIDPESLADSLYTAIMSNAADSNQTKLMEKCWTAVKIPLWQGDWLRAELGYRFIVAKSISGGLSLTDPTVDEARQALFDSVGTPAWSIAKERFTNLH